MSFFPGSKKRDLIGKSQNGENSDSAGSLPDDVCSDSFNSPECAKVFINCL